MCLWLSSGLCKPRLSRTTDALGWEVLSCSCHTGIVIVLLSPSHLSSSPCLFSSISVTAPIVHSTWSFYKSEHPEDTVEFHFAEYITVFPPVICHCVLSVTMISKASRCPESVPKPQCLCPVTIREFCPSFLQFSSFPESLSFNRPCVFVSGDTTDGILGIKVANREQRAFRRISLSPGGEDREGCWGAGLNRSLGPTSISVIVVGFCPLSLSLSVCSCKYL